MHCAGHCSFARLWRQRALDTVRISSIAELDKLRTKLHASAEHSREALGRAVDGSTGLSLLELVKFHPIGCDPLDATRPLNLIEQVNQTFTYLVSLAAAEELLRRHSEAAPFILNLGARGGTDVISVDGTVGAEVFAAVRPTNNRKLAKDVERARSSGCKYSYVFYYSPGQHQAAEIDGIQVIPVELGDEMVPPVLSSSRWTWSRLNHMQVGRYAEYFVKMELTRMGFDVYGSEVDDRGIDFVIRRADATYYDVQVKSSRDLNYVFIKKRLFEPRAGLIAAVVLFLEGEPPRAYLIPSKAWLESSPVLVSRDYESGKSEPEWGIRLSRKNLPLLNEFHLDKIAANL